MGTGALLDQTQEANVTEDLVRTWEEIRRATPPDLGTLRDAIGDGLPFGPQQKVCLLRHGETVTNALGLVTGSRDVRLTDRGRQQAVTAGRQLSEYRFATAWASPLQRSRETRDIVLEAARSTGAARAIDDRLTERCLGELEGRKNRHVPEFAAGDFSFAPPGGENYLSVTYRALAFLHDLAALPARFQGTSLVSTHMGPLRVLDALVHPNPQSATQVLARRYANASPICRELTVLYWPAFLESHAPPSLAR